MTKTFSSLVAALAITASLAAATAPVSAYTATGDTSRISRPDLASGPIAGGDLGSGRRDQITGPIAGGGLGSGR